MIANDDDQFCLLGLEKCAVPILLYYKTKRRPWLLQKLRKTQAADDDMGAILQRASRPARSMALYMANQLAESLQPTKVATNAPDG